MLPTDDQRKYSRLLFPSLSVAVLCFTFALLYSLAGIIGYVTVSWSALSLLLAVLLGSSAAPLYVLWSRRKYLSAERQLIMVLTGGLLFWYWGVVPLYTYLTLTVDRLQLNWTAFIFLWEASALCGLFVYFAHQRFRPIARFLHDVRAHANANTPETPESIFNRLARYPTIIAVTQFVWSFVGYAFGTLQFRIFANLPLVEQLKNMANGVVMSLFLSLLLFIVLDVYFSGLRAELKRRYELPPGTKRRISRRLMSFTLLTAIGTVLLMGLLTFKSWQGIIQTQILLRMRDNAATALIDISQAGDEEAARHAVLLRLMQDFRRGERGVTFTLPDDSTEFADISLDPLIREQVETGASTILIDHQKDSKLLLIADDTETNRRLVSVVYLSEFYWVLGEPMKFFLFGAAAMVLVIFGLGVFLSFVATRSLERLTALVRTGDAKEIGGFSSGDELETLANALANSMQEAQELRENLELRVREQTKKLRENAEELALKNKALEEAFVKDEALLESLGEGVIAIDPHGHIMFINKIASAIFEKPSADLIGRSLYDPSTPAPYAEDEHGQFIPLERRPTFRALMSGKRQSTFMYQITKSGNRIGTQTTATPLILRGTTIGAVAVIRDVTEEKKVERAKSEFVSIASHQFRTPLSILSWYTEVLLSHDFGPLTEKQRKFVQEIHQATRRLAALVNTILQITKIELGALPLSGEKSHAENLLEEAIAESRQETERKNLTIIKNFEAGMPELSLNADILLIVCKNIVSNAVRYTPPHGTITVSTQIDKTRGGVEFSVKDTGYGIPPDEQHCVFTRLFRASNVSQKGGEGTGIGLYIVKLVLDRIGGTVRFESELNTGTTFFVHLPLKAPEDHPEEKDGNFIRPLDVQ